MFRRRKWQLITFNEIPHAVQLDSNFTSRITRKRQDPTDGECCCWLCLYYGVRCETSCQNVVGWVESTMVTVLSLQSTWTWLFRSMDLFFLINGRLECHVGHVQKKQGMWWDYHSFVMVYHISSLSPQIQKKSRQSGACLSLQQVPNPTRCIKEIPELCAPWTGRLINPWAVSLGTIWAHGTVQFFVIEYLLIYVYIYIHVCVM